MGFLIWHWTIKRGNSMNKYKIPFLASLLLKIITLGDNDFSIIREINDEFNDIAHYQGIDKAHRWFWRQLLKSLPLTDLTMYNPL